MIAINKLPDQLVTTLLYHKQSTKSIITVSKQEKNYKPEKVVQMLYKKLLAFATLKALVGLYESSKTICLKLFSRLFRKFLIPHFYILQILLIFHLTVNLNESVKFLRSSSTTSKVINRVLKTPMKTKLKVQVNFLSHSYTSESNTLLL